MTHSIIHLAHEGMFLNNSFCIKQLNLKYNWTLIIIVTYTYTVGVIIIFHSWDFLYPHTHANNLRYKQYCSRMPGEKMKKKPLRLYLILKRNLFFPLKYLLISRSVCLHTCSPEVSQPRRKVSVWCPRGSRANSLMGRHGCDFYLMVYKICLT